jgi:hypothetical protein
VLRFCNPRSHVDFCTLTALHAALYVTGARITSPCTSQTWLTITGFDIALRAIVPLLIDSTVAYYQFGNTSP